MGMSGVREWLMIEKGENHEEEVSAIQLCDVYDFLIPLNISNVRAASYRTRIRIYAQYISRSCYECYNLDDD